MSALVYIYTRTIALSMSGLGTSLFIHGEAHETGELIWRTSVQENRHEHEC
jgi:hypothetical protein